MVFSRSDLIRRVLDTRYAAVCSVRLGFGLSAGLARCLGSNIYCTLWCAGRRRRLLGFGYPLWRVCSSVLCRKTTRVPASSRSRAAEAWQLAVGIGLVRAGRSSRHDTSCAVRERDDDSRHVVGVGRVLSLPAVPCLVHQLRTGSSGASVCFTRLTVLGTRKRCTWRSNVRKRAQTGFVNICSVQHASTACGKEVRCDMGTGPLCAPADSQRRRWRRRQPG